MPPRNFSGICGEKSSKGPQLLLYGRRSRFFRLVMAVGELHDGAEKQEQGDGADDEAGESSAHVGAMCGVRVMLARMRVGHGKFESRRDSLGDAYAVDDVVLLDLLHDVESLNDLAENGVNAIEVPAVCVAQDNEELAAAGVLTGVGHRERADLVGFRIAGSLALDLVAGSAGADSRIARGKITGERVTALEDEIGDDAMELHAVVEATIGELLEVLDRLGRV